MFSSFTIFQGAQQKYQEHKLNAEQKTLELEEERKHFREQCLVHKEFRVPRSDNLLTAPVVLMPCGHCFNQQAMGSVEQFTCPEHKTEYKKESFISSALLDNAVKSFEDERQKIFRSINTLSANNKRDVTIKIAEYLSNIMMIQVEQFNQLKSALILNRQLKAAAEEKLSAIPDDFLDSFTQEIFVDPFLTKHGHVYNRALITQWVASNGSCPLSRGVLRPEDICDYEKKSEEGKYQQRIRELINEYKRDRDQLVELVATQKLTSTLLAEFKERTQIKVAEFQKVKLSMRFLELSRKLKARCECAGLPEPIKPEEFEVPVLLDDDRWGCRKAAVRENQSYIDVPEYVNAYRQFNEKLFNLYAEIEQATYEQENAIIAKIRALQDTHEELKRHANRLLWSQRYSRKLREVYRISGLPFPPRQPSEVEEQVILENGRWEPKANVAANRIPFYEVPSLMRNQYQFHADVAIWSEQIKSVTLERYDALYARMEQLQANHRALQQQAERIQKKLTKVLQVRQNLKINWKNEEDLKFWHTENDPCWHGYGGVKIVFHPPEAKDDKEDRIYRVPTRIHALMKWVSEVNFQNEIDDGVLSIIEIHRIKANKPSRWNNPFSWMTRSKTTQEVYERETISQPSEELKHSPSRG